MATYLIADILYLRQYVNIQLCSDSIQTSSNLSTKQTSTSITKLNYCLGPSAASHFPPLLNLKAVSIVHDGRDTEVKVRHLPVNKVEDLRMGSAVELSFDSLRVCVRSELLAGVLSDQKQCVILRVGDFEFVSAEWANLLCACVRVDNHGFGRAALVHFLQSHTEIILQRETRSHVLTLGSTDRGKWILIVSWASRQKENTCSFIQRKTSFGVVKYSTRGSFRPKYGATDPHAVMLVETVDVVLFAGRGPNTASFMHLSNAERQVWMNLEMVQLRLTAWTFKVGSGQAWYLKVVHRWHWTLGGASAVPLVQGVPGLRAQHPGCLLLLEVLDEGHGSIGTGQVVASWGVEGKERCLRMDGEKKQTELTGNTSWLVV